MKNTKQTDYSDVIIVSTYEGAYIQLDTVNNFSAPTPSAEYFSHEQGHVQHTSFTKSETEFLIKELQRAVRKLE